jgi:hypothetical protein
MLVFVPNGSIHKLVALSLPPLSMFLLLYHTVHADLSNRTLHPASVSMTMMKREAMESSGMMCPVRTTGSPSMCISHMCVDVTLLPSAWDTTNGHVVGHLLTTGVPSMMKNCVAPKSAMASFVFSGNAAQVKCCGGGMLLNMPHLEEPVFDVMTVLSSSLGFVEHADMI